MWASSRGGGRLAASMLLLLLLLAVAVVPPAAHAQAIPPQCPGLAVRLAARPATRKPGSHLTVKVKVRNTGPAALQDVGLRVTVPLSATYVKAAVFPRIRGNYTVGPVFQAPQVYWPRFSLEAGKSRFFRLRAKVSPCQAAGTFTLEAAAYQPGLNCSSTTVVQTRARIDCPSQAPTPTPALGFAVYATNQRCLQARPASSFVRRLLTGTYQDALADCYRQCYYDAGLPLPFYFTVDAGVCYCCDHCSPVLQPNLNMYKALSVPVTPAPTGAPTTAAPSTTPTAAPTVRPTTAPSSQPTTSPTFAPTQAPTGTEAPSKAPTFSPTTSPSQAPTRSPSQAPTSAPTTAPSASPSAAGATTAPTTAPATADTYFWSIGGSVDDVSGATTVRYINPAATSPAWVNGPALSVSRGTQGAAMYSGMANAWNNSIYVYGGSDSAYYFVDIMVKLDVTNLAAGWSRVTYIGSNALVRYNGVSATLNGVFYYVGGFNSNAGNAFVADTSSYDPSTNILTPVVTGATLPGSVGSTVATSRGCLVALNGALYYMRNALLLKWAPGDSSWTTITTSAPWQTSDTPACAAYNGKVVQMVGTNAATYDPASQTFAALAGTTTRNHNHPVAQTCPSASDPIGEIVAPVDSSNPIQVDSYATGTWAALPNYVANLAAKYMTTVACTGTPQ